MVILERRIILPEHQADFQPRKSTLNNIIRLTKYAQNQMHASDCRRHAAVILFDIKTAFDSNRTAAIEIENTLSRSFNLNSDTRQGSPLSLLLYIICAADSMNGIPQHTEYGLFADNTALWTSSNTITSLSSKLQQSVDEFQSWCKSWKLKLQPTKTKLIYFTIHPQKSLRIHCQFK
ncbi:unnamed protein product [Rotaria magnacalcarata]|uniref:Reverse transcriptase domain-containing protein n=1 Tax=Rotaria magnacalcarata TaxID=392030 RepID=A0A816QIJ4_9BILA|nr:unnamed protein product [Rotaria magnacalcarata]